MEIKSPTVYNRDWLKKLVGHRYRKKDELVSCLLLWTPILCSRASGRDLRLSELLKEDTGLEVEYRRKAMEDQTFWRIFTAQDVSNSLGKRKGRKAV